MDAPKKSYSTMTVADRKTLVKDVRLVPYWFGMEEDGPSTSSGAFTVYPNPTDGMLFIETHGSASLQGLTYRICNLTGQGCCKERFWENNSGLM